MTGKFVGPLASSGFQARGVALTLVEKPFNRDEWLELVIGLLS